MAASTDEKVRSNQARKVLRRRGYLLVKAKRYDPAAIDYGRYKIVNRETYEPVAGVSPLGLATFTIEDVEAWIDSRSAGAARSEH